MSAVDSNTWPQHETVPVKPPAALAGYLGRKPLPIDAKLAPLVRLLWARGILTEQCCEERWPGLAWIVFPSTSEASEFLYVAQRDYRVDVDTWNEGEERDGGRVPCVQLYVAFPTAEIPRLVEAFAAARRR